MNDTGDKDLPRRVAALEDLEALRNLKSRYAMGADKCLSTPSRAHAEELVELFTDDAVGDYGFFGRFEGRAQLVHAFENVLTAATRWSLHYMANPVLEVDGSHAKGSWYFLVYAVAKDAPPGPPQNFFGRYEDRYVKTEEGWKIQSTTVLFVQPPS